MNKFLVVILLTIAAFTEVNSQTATLNTQVVFPNIKDSLNYIRFSINNQRFGKKDTIIQIRLNTNALDTCQVIIANDTINFLAKFKEGESYDVRQGCCCAAFTLEPKNNAKRGTVTFKNTTIRDLGLVIAESNSETIKVHKSKTMFANESAMCMFKPCSILITEPLYFSEKYSYQNDKRDYDTLWQEQTQYILAKSFFLFLHGEKIELYYIDKSGDIQIRHKGYLTDEEYEDIRK